MASSAAFDTGEIEFAPLDPRDRHGGARKVAHLAEGRCRAVARGGLGGGHRFVLDGGFPAAASVVAGSESSGTSVSADRRSTPLPRPALPSPPRRRAAIQGSLSRRPPQPGSEEVGPPVGRRRASWWLAGAHWGDRRPANAHRVTGRGGVGNATRGSAAARGNRTGRRETRRGDARLVRGGLVARGWGELPRSAGCGRCWPWGPAGPLWGRGDHGRLRRAGGVGAHRGERVSESGGVLVPVVGVLRHRRCEEPIHVGVPGLGRWIVEDPHHRRRGTLGAGQERVSSGQQVVERGGQRVQIGALVAGVARCVGVEGLGWAVGG